MYFLRPSDADTATISIQKGDLIVMATDGLFDNMFQSQIVERLRLIDKFVSIFIALAM